MFPSEDPVLKKAAEKLLEFSGGLAVTFHAPRSDLLISAIWYCLKEEQKKVKKLEDALKLKESSRRQEFSRWGSANNRETASSEEKYSASIQTAVFKNTSKASKADNRQNKHVHVVENKSAPVVPSPRKTVHSQQNKKAKNVSSKTARTKSSDSDICIIEIDDNDADEEKKKDEHPQQKRNQKDSFILPAGKSKEKSAEKKIAETHSSNVTDIDELFEMDCEEINDEHDPGKGESGTKCDKNASEKEQTLDLDVTVISDDEDEQKQKKSTSELKTTVEEIKTKTKQIGKRKKDTKENGSQEDVEEMNILIDDNWDDQETSEESKSVGNDYSQSLSHNGEEQRNSKSKGSSETLVVPTGLTQNVAEQSVNVASAISNAVPYSAVFSQGVTTGEESSSNIGISSSQQKIAVPSVNQNFKSELVSRGTDINAPQYPGLSENNSDSERPNLEVTLVGPGEDVMTNTLASQPQYFNQSQITIATTADIKTEIDSGSSEGIALHSGYIFEPHAVGNSFMNTTFSSQPYVVTISDTIVSLSSLASGALTYPYSSTDTLTDSYDSKPFGSFHGAYEPGYFHEGFYSDGHKVMYQGEKRGKSVDTVSPPTKKRLLDFDRKWHEGPSSSKGQERYIALPSNAMKAEPSYWNEDDASITETEWAKRFYKYQSVSNHIPPLFPVTDSHVVLTETVGYSLDDIGFNNSDASEADVKEVRKPGRGRFRGRGRWGGRRGQRGRSLSRGKASVSTERSLPTKRGRGRSSRRPGSSRARGRHLSAPKAASPQKSTSFSFYKKGRVTRARSRSRGFSRASIVTGTLRSRGRRGTALLRRSARGAVRKSWRGSKSPGVPRGTRGVIRGTRGRRRGRGRPGRLQPRGTRAGSDSKQGLKSKVKSEVITLD